MSKTGPILLVEDDLNYMDVVKSAISDSGVTNKVVCLNGATNAMHYLLHTSDKPFLILCEVYMNGINGLEFRDLINENDFLRKKSIPFLFLTAAVSKEIIDEAYELTVQGFIEKPKVYEDLKHAISVIFNYWTTCLHPNSF